LRLDRGRGTGFAPPRDISRHLRYSVWDRVNNQEDKPMADSKGGAAAESDKQRIEQRMQSLEASDLDAMRQRVQMENARGIRDIADKYGIPSSELQQSGVRVPRARRAQ
jgi:hypothetical protein